MVEGTSESQLSSSLLRVVARDVYHDPAWLATRVVMAENGRLFRAFAKLRYRERHSGLCCGMIYSKAVKE